MGMHRCIPRSLEPGPIQVRETVELSSRHLEDIVVAPGDVPAALIARRLGLAQHLTSNVVDNSNSNHSKRLNQIEL